MSGGYEPRWDRVYGPDWHRDRDYGEAGEAVVDKTIAALREGRVAVEVKRKRRQDNRFYVELGQAPGRRGEYKPSGALTSQADFWAFITAGTGVVLFTPAWRLRAAILGADLGWPAEESDGDNPTRGRLLTFNQIIAAELDEPELAWFRRPAAR